MSAAFNAYLKHMARISCNLTDCVHCCLVLSFHEFFLNSGVCSMNLVFVLAERLRIILLYAIVKAQLH